MWIKIREQYINLDYIQTMRWSDKGDIVSLYMYPTENNHIPNCLTFDWKVKNNNGTKNYHTINHLTNVAKRISKATGIIVKRFKCELGQNNIKDESVGEFIGE